MSDFIEYKMFFSLTEVCKANCKYCDFPKYQKVAKTSTMQDIDYVFNIIQECKNVYPGHFKKFTTFVEGGELGEVPENILDYFFSKNNPIQEYFMFTNGIFLKHNYHKKYEKFFKDISFHITLEHSIKESLETLRKNKEYISDVLIVVTEQNADTAYNVIKNNPDINFKFQRQINRKGSKYYTKDTYIEKVTKIFELPNILGEIDEINIVKNDKHIDVKRKMCANNYTRIFVDVTNRRLYRCQGTRTVSYVDLNKDNFMKMIINKEPVFDTLMDETCKTCEHIKMHNNNPFDVKNSAKIFRKVKKYVR